MANYIVHYMVITFKIFFNTNVHENCRCIWTIIRVLLSVKEISVVTFCS